MNGFPILSVILFLPLAGAVGAIFLPRLLGWGWSLLVALADLGLCIWLVTAFNLGTAGFQYVERAPWMPQFGINYLVGVDGINVFLVGLNALLTVIAVGASWRVARNGERSREYFVLMMFLCTGMQGVFLATNLFLFYVFWEVMLVPAYLLVGIYGGERRAYAAIKFFIYTSVGSLLMLVGIIATGFIVSANAHIGYTLDLATLVSAGVPRGAQLVLFLAFFAAFAIKAGLFPFHSWVPDTYSQAPVPVVVLISGVMAKTAVYGFLRFNLALFPDASHLLTPMMEILAVISILYFAGQALVAQDMMRLVAYVSISAIGVMILGIFALNTQGVEGAVIQMVNHGILIAALFLITGFIEARIGTRRLADFGGLATRLPVLTTAFLIIALATLGLPGLNSFAGEFLAFLGAFHANYVYGTLGTAVVIPVAWYMLRYFQGVSHGPIPSSGPVAELALESATAPNAATTAVRDLDWRELLLLAPLIGLIVYLGLVPGVLTSRIERSVNALPPVQTSLTPSHASPVVRVLAGAQPFVLVRG